MIRLPTLTPRMGLILAHDLVATAVAVLASFYVRFDDVLFAERRGLLFAMLPAIIVYAGCVYLYLGLHKAKWRFTSLPDLVNIVRAAVVIAVTLLALDYVLVAPNVYGRFFFGKITIALYGCLQIAFLAGPRIAYRYLRYTRILHHAKRTAAPPALVLARAAEADVLLRAVESGAVGGIRPVGILSPSVSDRGQSIRDVPVLGDLDDLERVIAELVREDTPVTRLVLAQGVLAPDLRPEAILARARRLGLAVSRMPAFDAGESIQLAPVNVEDLLLRPSVTIDYRRIGDFVRGKSAVVTGGGGSIGAEICDRLVAFGAARLLILENAEPALSAVMQTLSARNAPAEIDGRIADVRDRARVMSLVAAFKPDIVFHAAALKHVPQLERDWEEGIRTNVFGSVNVADAAAAAGARAMVMVSTDKAVEPISVLGATKRIAEMYCQARDAEARRADGARFIAVRFGNVLASTGSVVPKFKAQTEAGGPVTVTHPDMVRYFMTIREACDLVLTAATHAMNAPGGDASVYVLNMGQPVKIAELAERLIRLSGLEPGRDIEIAFTGIRPGERLQEVLFARDEKIVELGIDGVVAARPQQVSLEIVRTWLADLEVALSRGDRGVIERMQRTMRPELPRAAE